MTATRLWVGTTKLMRSSSALRGPAPAACSCLLVGTVNVTPDTLRDTGAPGPGSAPPGSWAILTRPWAAVLRNRPPMLRTRPGPTSARSIRTPSTNVPLVEPRSSTRCWPCPRGVTRAWWALTMESWTTIALSAARPRVRAPSVAKPRASGSPGCPGSTTRTTRTPAASESPAVRSIAAAGDPERPIARTRTAAPDTGSPSMRVIPGRSATGRSDATGAPSRKVPFRVPRSRATQPPAAPA